MNPTIDILLATYQGEAFLDEQLLSLFNQSYSDFHLYIRDDSSKDQTRKIIEKWQATYPEQITLLPSSSNLGIVENFSRLLEASQADYILFADQDDKWLPDKVERTLKAMRELEAKYGAKSPLLVHTDLKVVDQELKEIAPSFWRYSHLDPSKTELKDLLLQNIATGCTMMMNRPLLLKSFPIPKEALMHDWWIALTASAFGKIGLLEEATLLYRQHRGNDTGAKKYSLGGFLKRALKESSQKKKKKGPCDQGRAFLERYASDLNQEQRELLLLFNSLDSLPFLKQKKALFLNHFSKHGFLRNLKLFLTPL